MGWIRGRNRARPVVRFSSIGRGFTVHRLVLLADDWRSCRRPIKAFTFQGIVAFVLMFGLVGLALSRSDMHQMVALLAGTAAGGASMWTMGKMFQVFYSVQSSGNMNIDNAVGANATVYMRIKPGEVGQVQVEVQGAMRTLDAVAKDPEAYFKSGDTVTVKEIIAGRMVVVPYGQTSESE